MAGEGKNQWFNKILWFLLMSMGITVVVILSISYGTNQRATRMLRIDASQMEGPSASNIAGQQRSLYGKPELSTPNKAPQSPIGNLKFPDDFLPACLYDNKTACWLPNPKGCGSIPNPSQCTLSCNLYCDCTTGEKGYVLNPCATSTFNTDFNYFYFVNNVSVNIPTYIYNDTTKTLQVDSAKIIHLSHLVPVLLNNRPDRDPLSLYDVAPGSLISIGDLFLATQSSSIATTYSRNNPIRRKRECTTHDYLDFLLGQGNPSNCSSFSAPINQTQYLEEFKSIFDQEAPGNPAECTALVRKILTEQPCICQDCTRGCLCPQQPTPTVNDTSFSCDQTGALITPLNITNQASWRSIKSIVQDINSICEISNKTVLACTRLVNSQNVTTIKTVTLQDEISFDQVDQEGIIQFMSSQSPCYYSSMSLSFSGTLDDIIANETVCAHNKNRLSLYPNKCPQNPNENSDVTRFKYKVSEGALLSSENNQIFTFQNCTSNHNEDENHGVRAEGKKNVRNPKRSISHKRKKKMQPQAIFEVFLLPSTTTDEPPQNCQYFSLFSVVKTSERLRLNA